MNTVTRSARLHRAFLSTAIVAVGLLTIGTPTRANGKEPGDADPGFKSLTVIGDSLSDTGRLFRATGVPPAPYYQGRMSNGPLWVEHFAPLVGLRYEPLDNFA